jgi:ECF sigma factor
LPLVYDELRKLAAPKLRHEKPGQTLQATALVHEVLFRDGQRDAFETGDVLFVVAGVEHQFEEWSPGARLRQPAICRADIACGRGVSRRRLIFACGIGRRHGGSGRLRGRHAQRNLINHPAPFDWLEGERELHCLRARRKETYQLQPIANHLGRLGELRLDNNDWAQVELLLTQVGKCPGQVGRRIPLAKAPGRGR